MPKIINPGTQYYVLSLKHTHKKDKYMTLWRANNSGYCYGAESAGIYQGYEDGYHLSDGNMPVEVSVLDDIFMKVPYDTGIISIIPNAAAVWDILGLKWKKGELIAATAPTQS